MAHLSVIFEISECSLELLDNGSIYTRRNADINSKTEKEESEIQTFQRNESQIVAGPVT